MSLIEQLRALPPSEARRELERAEIAYIKSRILPLVQAAFVPCGYRLEFLDVQGEGNDKRILWEEIEERRCEKCNGRPRGWCPYCCGTGKEDGHSREFCTDYDGLKVLP